MSFVIKVDDFVAIVRRDHELFLAIKLVFLFAIHEGVGHEHCYIGKNSNPITRVHWIPKHVNTPWYMYIVICHDWFPLLMLYLLEILFTSNSQC